jgi:uncharacterized glyoxalase superfamily protein PhnB
MTAHRSITTSVDVPVDPDTAFKVFTEELGCWWRQGPINFFDSSRAFEMRMEHGVGGRIVEVYDDAGDGLEVARLTAWEPGERLEWTSSLDDVRTEIRFRKATDGTTVEVTATIEEGGTDNGGTAWTRVVPAWLGSWIGRRDHVARVPEQLARLAITVRYAAPVAAAHWLRDVGGLELESRIPTDDASDHMWIEFRAGSASIVVLPLDGARQSAADPVTHAPWIYVDDLDSHYANATSRHATVIEEIWQHGARAYTLADPEGNQWTFVQAGPVMRGASLV